MLMPRKVKHRKQQRGRMKGAAKGGTELSFGEYGIQALEPGWLTARQIEAARIAMTRAIKRGGKVWINVFPDKPVTKKPAEVRMGSGKGAPDHWVAVVKPGRVMFEMSGVPEAFATLLEHMNHGGKVALLGIPPPGCRPQRRHRRHRSMAVSRSLASDHPDARSGRLHPHRARGGARR